MFGAFVAPAVSSTGIRLHLHKVFADIPSSRYRRAIVSRRLTRHSFLSLCIANGQTPLAVSSATSSGKRPYGYWLSQANISAELKAFAVAQGDASRMPTALELARAGRSDLAGAIRRIGTWRSAARAAGLTPTCIARPRSIYLTYCTQLRTGRLRPDGYWRDFANLQRDLELLCGKTGTLPSARMLIKAERSDLVRAIANHGGFGKVATRMGRLPRYRSRSYWERFENVRKEILDIAAGSNAMPCLRVLRERGQPGLVRAVTMFHGGCAQVARKCGLKPPTPRRKNGYWKQPANMSKELKDFVQKSVEHKEHSPEMPTYSEMVRAGREDLARAIVRYYGMKRAAKEASLIYCRK